MNSPCSLDLFPGNGASISSDSFLKNSTCLSPFWAKTPINSPARDVSHRPRRSRHWSRGLTRMRRQAREKPGKPRMFGDLLWFNWGKPWKLIFLGSCCLVISYSSPWKSEDSSRLIITDSTDSRFTQTIQDVTKKIVISQMFFHQDLQ